MSIDPKDMAPLSFSLVLSSRPSLLHKSRVTLTVPEWLVKVIQHFIVPLVASSQTSGAKEF